MKSPRWPQGTPASTSSPLPPMKPTKTVRRGRRVFRLDRESKAKARRGKLKAQKQALASRPAQAR